MPISEKRRFGSREGLRKLGHSLTPPGGSASYRRQLMRSNSENVPHWRVPAVGLICLALFCVSTVFLEYEMLLVFGAAFIVFAAASTLAVIFGVLYRAPEGDERDNGLHIPSLRRGARRILRVSVNEKNSEMHIAATESDSLSTRMKS